MADLESVQIPRAGLTDMRTLLKAIACGWGEEKQIEERSWRRNRGREHVPDLPVIAADSWKGSMVNMAGRKFR